MKYEVYIDITVSKSLHVDAESEEQARNEVRRMMTDDPYYYAKTADSYVGYKVLDVNEEYEE